MRHGCVKGISLPSKPPGTLPALIFHCPDSISFVIASTADQRRLRLFLVRGESFSRQSSGGIDVCPNFVANQPFLRDQRIRYVSAGGGPCRPVFRRRSGRSTNRNALFRVVATIPCRIGSPWSPPTLRAARVDVSPLWSCARQLKQDFDELLCSFLR